MNWPTDKMLETPVIVDPYRVQSIRVTHQKGCQTPNKRDARAIMHLKRKIARASPIDTLVVASDGLVLKSS